MESQVTPADARLINAFVAFALDPDDGTARRLPLSPNGVKLGLGRHLLQRLPLGQADEPSSWEMRTPTYFRAYEGPLSALQTIRRHVESGADILLSLGEHPHCASPPVPPPRGMKALRRVSLQPSEASITTCLNWFTVDLFLDRDRNVVAVTLDLWEP